MEIAYCYLRIINYVLWFVKGAGRGVLFGVHGMGIVRTGVLCLVHKASYIHIYM